MTATLDQTYAALADPTRRAILQRLRVAEARVTEVAEPLPMSLAAVSKHIAVLERAGLIKREIRGRDHFLRADPLPLDAAQAWIADYTSFWEARADALADHLARTFGGPGGDVDALQAAVTAAGGEQRRPEASEGETS